MATLVLSTVGTMLGGPVGGAIGSLIGQSIDQQLLGGGPQRGPRIGDLSVQSSTYGTPIPRVYGTMRVAGSVIWATDLQEGSTYVGGKGQPESVVYNYTVSIAIALSSRQAVRVGRIWADGKLLRGAAGDFKVKTQFRFYGGSQDQVVDPLIASLEGIANTPAYRGLALAVFEDLELAEFGNRIPFMTFELFADETAPSVTHVLEDVTESLIECDDQRSIPGYAAHGNNRRGAIEPLINCFNIRLVQDGARLRSASTGALSMLEPEELGCSPDGKAEPVLERHRDSEENIPESATITYYDPSRNFQAGLARASLVGGGRTELRLDAPMVLDTGQAKGLAQDLLGDRWTRRDKIVVRLSPKWMGLNCGDRLLIPGVPGQWEAERCAVEGMSLLAELRPVAQLASSLAADPGKAFLSPDELVGPTRLAVFDLPSLDGSNSPQIHVATASATKGWKPVPLNVAVGQVFTVSSAVRQSLLGEAKSALPAGQALLLDLLNSVDVQLIDPSDWLTSCDDEALAGWCNLAVLGDELIQFGSAEAIGPGRFRLSRLLRGRRGSEWATGTHQSGEAFALLVPGTVKIIELPSSASGTEVAVTPLGLADGQAVAATRNFAAEAQRPPSPVDLKAARGSNGDLYLSWVRRSRSGWDWLDGVGTPLGEATELYRVSIAGIAATIEVETLNQQLTVSQSSVQTLGAGGASVSVRQVGDRALSRAVTVSIPLH